MQTTTISHGTLKAPPEILAALREIDPRADLIHLGGSHWWLGTRQPNPAGVKALSATVHGSGGAFADNLSPFERAAAEQELALELEMRQIQASGFKSVALYDVDPGEEWRIVDDFRFRDFQVRTKSLQQLEREARDAFSAEAGNRRRLERAAALLREKAREVADWFTGRRHFGPARRTPAGSTRPN